jgi:hypothetical protein
MRRRGGVCGVIYHGHRRHPFECVVTVESADGELIGVLPHIPLHSPTGMNWGYAGAGPRDTARSLLIDALGPDAICPVCQGTCRVTYVAEGDGYRAVPFSPARCPRSRHGWRCTCSGGYKHLPYGAFADQFVTHWGDEWAITAASILAWLAGHAQASELAEPG